MVQGDADSGLHGMLRRGHGIPYQQQIHMGVEQFGESRGIGGETDDRLLPLARSDGSAAVNGQDVSQLYFGEVIQLLLSLGGAPLQLHARVETEGGMHMHR